jgi:quinol monooxygenase YgiN
VLPPLDSRGMFHWNAGMTLIRVWQYDVRPGAEQGFEEAYGAGGTWAQLFALNDGHLGTELFRSLDVPGRYVTIDRFIDLQAWRRFVADHGPAYQQLDESCAELTVSERELAEVERLI